MRAAWLAFLFPLALVAVPQPEPKQAPAKLRFRVTVADGLLAAPTDGRVLVVLGKPAGPEPRKSIGQSGLKVPPVLGTDTKQFGPGKSVVLDGKAVTFPIENLSRLPPGEYGVQAVFDHNRDLKLPNAPGNLYSEVQRVRLDPSREDTVELRLTQQVPAEKMPAETERIKYIKLRSELLSQFHGRPIYLRAGVRLPRDFAAAPEKRYPLRVHIGGYGSRFSVMPQDDPAGDALVLLTLDGAGPLGDPYQVNSANHGPYGDAVTHELIPHVEKRFRCVGKPHARFLDGGSTGGWVALALQVFYPDYFNGAWSFCPDPVDFRAFQLIDIYKDANAYVNRHGFERPGARDRDGDVRETMRHQCQLENVLGRGDSWTTSGQQWGSWNAVFGPRGPDGLPMPLWDPRTGALNRKVVDHWKKYDLRRVLDNNWQTLGPKLKGKLRIWVGEADDFFLNNAVHLLDKFLSQADPPYGGTIAYKMGEGHCWSGITQREMIGQMLDAMKRGEKR
jgi:S-formylglutathione hydrolase FrmB